MINQIFLSIVQTIIQILLKNFITDYHKKEYKLAKKVVKKLTKTGKTVSSAESVTGGQIADAIVSVSGASKVYEEGYITYSDFAKVKNLMVDPEVIEVFGVVSPEVASEMVRGLLYAADSDYALATTGCAGPDSDEYGTKVGSVFIACASRQHVIIRKYQFKGNRTTIRNKATIAAFKLLLYMIKMNY